MSNKEWDTIRYAGKHPSYWQFYFELYEKIPYSKLVGTNNIKFKTESTKGTNFVKGFEIMIKQEKEFEAYWKATNKAHRLCNLMSVIYGDYIGSKLVTMIVTNAKGTCPSTVVDASNPLKPKQELILDLNTNTKADFVNQSSHASRQFGYIASALHASYKTPWSAIKDLVLALDGSLTGSMEKYENIRDGLSHTQLRDETYKAIQQAVSGVEFTKGKQIDLTTEKNYGFLRMTNFHLLHHTLEKIRNKYDLNTKKIKT